MRSKTTLSRWLQKTALWLLLLSPFLPRPCSGASPPPTITVQPLSQTVLFQGSVTFSVVASTTTTLSYQWRKNGSSISGATLSSYTIASVQTTDAATYTVKVTNARGSVTSAGATLTVLVPPTIVTQPQNQTATLGKSATFSAVANGTAPLGYQWNFNGTALAGATNSALTLTNVQVTNSYGSFYVTVSNVVGVVYSTNATLTVNVPPTITSQPQSQTVTLTGGQNVTFNAGASGTTPLSYQWNFNGSALAGATNATLQLNNIQATNAGSYTAVVTNVAGSATSALAMLKINIPPAITTQPQSQAGAVSSNVTFSVVASGTAPLGYQWSFNGTALSGAASSALTLTNVQMSNAGSYSVVVTNIVGSAYSASAALTVGFAPAITTQPQSQTVSVGGNAAFSVVATGMAPLGYQWNRNGTAVSGATSSALSLTSVSTGSAGSYTVVVTNFVGSVTSALAALTVATSPVFLTQPQNLTVVQGQTASFHVDMAGATQMYYTWYMNGSSVGSAWLGLSYTLWISNVQASAAGPVYVKVLNSYNLLSPVASATATLTVLVPPRITTQPQSRTAAVGQSTSFSVVASGTAPLSYQWNFNGTAVSGTTNATLTLSNPQLTDAGSYTVVVTNGAGSVTSAVAALTVYVPPAITTHPQSQTVTQGVNVAFSVVASGSTPLRYQWNLNGTALSGATSPALALTNVQTTDAGSYMVVVTNVAGSVTSAVAVLRVLVPPAIQTQPTDLTVMQGLSAAISVGASGTVPLGYQWSLNGTNLSGATNASLAWSNVQPAQAGDYSVVITNSAGSVTSAVATLSVIAVPPGSYVEAVITSRPLAYWRLDEPSGTTAFDYVGGNDATYANVALNQPGALATDSDTATCFNGTSAYAGTGVRLVNNLAAFTLEGWCKLVAGGARMGFWGQNNAIEFGLSSPTIFNLYTAGGGNLYVTNLNLTTAWGTNNWHHLAAVGNGTHLLLYVDGILAGTGGSTTTNYGSSTYPFNIGGGGIFDAATNWFNGCLDEIALYSRALPAVDIKRHYLLGLALPALTLTAPTNNATFTAPANITLAANVVTNGHTITNVQFFNGATLLNTDTTSPYTYAWNNIGAGAYNVSAVANYDSGSVTSAVAAVTAYVTPGIQTQPQNLTVTQGQSASFSVVANGSAPFGYHWKLNGSPVSGATNASLTLASAQGTHAGTYTVVVTNPVGSVTSQAATLTVNIPPGITAQPQSQTAVQGQTVSFSVVASGTANLSYQWYLNGSSLSGGSSQAATLTFNNVGTGNAGNYAVVVNNNWGSVTSAVASLTVYVPAAITTQPQSQTATQGLSAAFSVVASGTAPLTYQWSFNGAPLAGATTATLAFTNIQTNAAGSYAVAVTNPAGSVTSQVATLTVNIPAGITTQPQSQTATQGLSAAFSVVASGDASLGYQWNFNGSSLSGATTSALALTHVQTTDAGSYTVAVTNSWGAVTSTVATLTVVPPTPPSFGSAGMTPDGFTFQLSVSVGSTYVIQASTNLQDWTPIYTNVALTGSLVFTDPAATNCPIRFYRALVQ
jgi:hypothetical protein